MSYNFDPMILRQMVLWLKQLSCKHVYKVNNITQECLCLRRSYYMPKQKEKKKKDRKPNQDSPHIIKAVIAMENDREKNESFIFLSGKWGCYPTKRTRNPLAYLMRTWWSLQKKAQMTVCHRLSSDAALTDMSGFDFCEFMHDPLPNTCFHIGK